MRWLLLALLPLTALAQDAGVVDDQADLDAGKSHVIENVKLTFTSSPGGAEVWYGKRMLGTTPVTFTRRKDSGPVDVVFRLGGYLKTNSRAYTWYDDKVHVKLVPVDQAHTLLGFKKPIEPSDTEGGEDEEN
jgi:hypothetical protein